MPLCQSGTSCHVWISEVPGDVSKTRVLLGCGACVDLEMREHGGNTDIPFSVQVKAASALCRASKNDCDLPEHCTGLSAECPEDVFQENGIPCQNGNGYCYNGACPSHGEQCRALWGTGSCSPPSTLLVHVLWARALLGCRPFLCPHLGAVASDPKAWPLLPDTISLAQTLALCDPFCVSRRGPGGS